LLMRMVGLSEFIAPCGISANFDQRSLRKESSSRSRMLVPSSQISPETMRPGGTISVIGVLLFTALTAYDTQKIEQMSRSPELQSNGDLAFKFSIIGAVTLYLDFINLFLFLLRLFAGGRD